MTSRYLICLFFCQITSFCLAKTPTNPTFKSTANATFIENKGQIIDKNNKPNPGVLYLLNTPGIIEYRTKNLTF